MYQGQRKGSDEVGDGGTCGNGGGSAKMREVRGWSFKDFPYFSVPRWAVSSISGFMMSNQPVDAAISMRF